VPALGFYGFFGSLYSVYVRGEANILDQRVIVLSDPVDAIARLQLCQRALLLQSLM
jgi:hypothetical protein